jgi:hypothetical protein
VSLTKKLLNAKYAILLTIYGFSSAYILTENIVLFESLPMVTQGVLVSLIAVIGVALVWKDSTQKSSGNK